MIARSQRIADHRNGSQTIANDRRRTQKIEHGSIFCDPLRSSAIMIAGSQTIAEVCFHMIADDRGTFCDLRSAIVCYHMETGPAGNRLFSLAACHFLSFHFSVRRRLSNIYVTPSFMRANNVQITFNIRQAEQVDSRPRPSLLSSWDSLASTFTQSTCGKSNWIVATIWHTLMVIYNRRREGVRIPFREEGETIFSWYMKMLPNVVNLSEVSLGAICNDNLWHVIT